MNTPSPHPASIPCPRFSARPQRNGTSTGGVALVIVLCMLTLAAILLVAFLSSVAIELRSAKSYAVGNDARSLTDSAVNIIISQIQDATATPTNAWASQPGMIRTYNPSGNLVMVYKLYSASAMRTNSFNPVTAVTTEVPANWTNLPDQYTDLNRPVTNSSGNVVYPIIDPGAVATSQSVTNAAMDGTTAPIQGCYIDQSNPDAGLCVSGAAANPVPMPVQWLYVLQDGTICTISSAGIISGISSTGATITPSTTNPIVGRTAFWTDDESCKVNINTSGEGTFWGWPHAASAYDVNFLGYSMPAANEFQRFPGHPAMTSLSVIFPMLSGETVPQYNERIYGIIPRLGPGGSQSGTVVVVANTNSPGSAASWPMTTNAVVPNDNRLFASVDEFLFSAANTTPRTVNLKEGTAPSGIPFTQADLEKARFFLTVNSRAPEVNMFNKPRISLWPLQANTVTNSVVTAAPACWTANDKLIAFCSTLGNTNTSTAVPYYFQRYNTFDPATIRTGAQTYPQSLSQSPIPSSQSTTLDWTLNGTSPNWTPSAGYPNRNQALFGYLQYLTSNPIPGLGGSLSGTSGTYKYSTSVRDQILTEIIDFIRSQVTTTCTGTTPTYFYVPSQLSGSPITGEHQIVPLEFNPPIYPGNGTAWGSTSSTNSYTTMGFGRFETIQQAAFVFYRMDPSTTTNTFTTNAITGSVTTNNFYVQGFTSNNPTAGVYGVSTNTPNTNTSVNVGVVLLLDPYNVSPGLRPWCENMRVQVTLTPPPGGRGNAPVMQVNGGGLNGTTSYASTLPANPFMTGNSPTTNTVLLTGTSYFDEDCSAMMGMEGFWYYNNNNVNRNGLKTLGTNTVGSSTEEQFYPLYGSFTLTNSPTQTNFTFTPPASITIQTYSGYDPGATANGVPSPSALVQTITMPFPPTTITLPVPLASAQTGSHSGKLINNYNNRPGGPLDSPAQDNDPSSLFVYGGGDVVRTVETRYGGPTNNFLPRGDMRMVAGLANVPTNYFDSYGATNSDDAAAANPANSYNTTTAMVHSLRMNPVLGNNFPGDNSGNYNGWSGGFGSLIGPANQGYLNGVDYFCVYPSVPRGLSCTNVVLSGSTYPNGIGDWDTGPGDQPDGPYINKPQEGFSEIAANLGNGSYGSPYMTGFNVNGGSLVNLEAGNTYSPNRLISSAVAFGSLPTGIDPANPTLTNGAPFSGSQSTGGMRPWQTLLFCPNPASEANNNGAPRHPGFGSISGTATNTPPYTIPPDHAFLDFFTMPIVEPYAISEPFSTAGKVNMNYQIVPFTYLNRDTAVRAVLKSVRMMAIPLNNAGGGGAYGSISYKVSATGTPDYRYTINPDEATGTLAGFTNRFGNGDIFRSASEICSLYLVPQYPVGSTAVGTGEVIPSANGAGTSGTGGSSTVPGSPTYSTMNSWWGTYGQLTGDNVREEPYGYIYPRLTTKSNTYTVHVWTQILQKAPTTAANQFVDGQDQVTSEYRGSVIIQRYLNPNANSLEVTDGTSPGDAETYPNAMVGPYLFRIVGTKRFAP